MDVTLRSAQNIVIKSMKKNLVPILLGPPGIGKSELVYQIAKVMNLKVVELRLSYRCPLDMIGLPQVKVVDGIDTATWAVGSRALRLPTCQLTLRKLSRRWATILGLLSRSTTSNFRKVNNCRL